MRALCLRRGAAGWRLLGCPVLHGHRGPVLGRAGAAGRHRAARRAGRGTQGADLAAGDRRDRFGRTVLVRDHDAALRGRRRDRRPGARRAGDPGLRVRRAEAPQGREARPRAAGSAPTRARPPRCAFLRAEVSVFVRRGVDSCAPRCQFLRTSRGGSPQASLAPGSRCRCVATHVYAGAATGRSARLPMTRPASRTATYREVRSAAAIASCPRSRRSPSTYHAAASTSARRQPERRQVGALPGDVLAGDAQAQSPAQAPLTEAAVTVVHEHRHARQSREPPAARSENAHFAEGKPYLIKFCGCPVPCSRRTAPRRRPRRPRWPGRWPTTSRRTATAPRCSATAPAPA